jgi:hypothetical protein
MQAKVNIYNDLRRFSGTAQAADSANFSPLSYPGRDDIPHGLAVYRDEFGETPPGSMSVIA